MNDPRWDQLAESLINYSTGTKPGDKVLITMMEVETLPLARAVYAHAVKAGALPHVEFQSAYLERDLMLHGSTEQLDWIPEMQAYGMEWADVYVGLRGARNPHEFTGISPERIAAHKRAMGKVSAKRNELTRWVLVRVPNESLAHQGGMWPRHRSEILNQGTDLRGRRRAYKYAGRRDLHCAGGRQCRRVYLL
jgi:aminopeptidase